MVAMAIWDWHWPVTDGASVPCMQSAQLATLLPKRDKYVCTSASR